MDPAELQVQVLLAGEERQNYPVSDMIFSPYEVVSHISHDMTLEPGDLIACGTSVGVCAMQSSSEGLGETGGAGTGPSP